jgi:hypothetical protein
MGVKLGFFHTERVHGPRVFGNRVQRKVFGCERYEVTGEWRRLQNEELHDCTTHRILFG